MFADPRPGLGLNLRKERIGAAGIPCRPIEQAAGEGGSQRRIAVLLTLGGEGNKAVKQAERVAFGAHQPGIGLEPFAQVGQTLHQTEGTSGGQVTAKCRCCSENSLVPAVQIAVAISAK